MVTNFIIILQCFTILFRHFFWLQISLLFSNKVNELAERIASLTDRENEIIVMMMKDLTNEEIASNLKLSVRTVNAHKGNIIRKIGAKTTSGLIKIIVDYSPSIKNEF